VAIFPAIILERRREVTKKEERIKYKGEMGSSLFFDIIKTPPVLFSRVSWTTADFIIIYTLYLNKPLYTTLLSIIS
jgi:hypothetical protein